MSIWGSIASAVAGPLIGGLFGNDEKTTTSRTNFRQLRDDAISAGFNPLTALRATGGAGHTTTTHPTLSSGQFVADALTRGVETWFNREQIERDAEADRLRNDMMRAELEGLNKANQAPANRSFGYSIPTVVEQAGMVPSGGNAGQAAGGFSVAPPLADPVMVNRNDGMTSANPDAPVEAEADLWVWARDGTLGPNIDTIIERNGFDNVLGANPGRKAGEAARKVIKRGMDWLSRPALTLEKDDPEVWDWSFN